MKLEGRVWKFGRDVDTDGIIPARYLSSDTAEELGKHCMEDLDPEFPSKVAKGDIIVAGDNFGCGSSREHAPLAIRGAGVAAVVAPSFARIFYRNAINTGLPILESEQAYQGISEGDRIRIDIKKGTIENLTTGETFEAAPYPLALQEIIEAGGLIESIRNRGRS